MRLRPLLPAIAALLLALAPGPPLRAEEPAPPPTPEAVAQTYMGLLTSGRFEEAAEMLHPEALEKLRGMLLPLVEAAGPEGAAAVLILFRGVTGVEELKKLSGPQFFASFLGGITEMNPALKQALASGTLTPIGTVPEGELIHVVSRLTVEVEGLSIAKMDVLSLRPHEGGWGVLLSGEMEGMAEALRRSFAARKPAPKGGPKAGGGG